MKIASMSKEKKRSDQAGQFLTTVWVVSWFVAIWIPLLKFEVFMTGLFAMVLAIIIAIGENDL